jgi:hypothetical protein
MSYATRAAAIASLREFSPALRKAHIIVKFYSEAFGCHRFARVLSTKRLARKGTHMRRSKC